MRRPGVDPSLSRHPSENLSRFPGSARLTCHFMKPSDHFSAQAEDYARYRPVYPESLIEFLANLAPARKKAWDAATGSGQCARLLAWYFDRVIATDSSAKQVEQATPHERIQYRVCPAEDSGIHAQSIDLITVAQAFHWLDFDRFYDEARRVGRPRAVIALWCYGIHEINPAVDAIAHKFYGEIVDPHWPPQVKWVRQKYKTLPFPFEEIEAPGFVMEGDWDLSHVLGNFTSWSSTQRYKKALGKDPLDLIRKDLEAAWGDPQEKKRARWPLFIRVGRLA